MMLMYGEAFPDGPLCPGALGFGAEDQNVTVDEAVDQIVKGLLKNAEDRG
jgi:hypothetical protein